MSGTPGTILVLAGSRGPDDPMARHAGVSHKALIPVGGVPMIERVINTLCSVPAPRSIVVAIEKPELLIALPEIKAAQAAGMLRIIPTAESPSRTVLSALEAGHVSPPFLITTADHPLLTVEMIAHFWQQVPPDADVAAAVASARTIGDAWPEARRTYLRFADDGYSGCNLFAVKTAKAREVIGFWQQVESRRKRPVAMIRLLGPAAVVRFLLGRMTLNDAVDHLGRLTGIRPAAITLPFPEAAVDVDKPDDLVLAERILAQRHVARPSL